METICGKMFRRFMSRQSLFFDYLSTEAREKLAAVEDKFAELRITGEEGGIFHFLYKGGHLIMLDEPPPVPWEQLDKLLLDGDNINYPSGDEVLFDVIDGDLSPRAVISRKYFRVNTDKIIYDTEEFAQAFERFLEDIRKILPKIPRIREPK